jgi:hypothetical protein
MAEVFGVKCSVNQIRALLTRWSAIISSDDVVAIHAALVPTTNGDGEIILFGGDNHFKLAARAFEADHGNEVDHSRRFNCRNPNLPLIHVQSPGFDVFCCGHAFIGDGRLLIAGGTAKFPADAEGEHQNLHFAGHRHCAAYNPITAVFENVADMGSEPGQGSTGGDDGILHFALLQPVKFSLFMAIHRTTIPAMITTHRNDISR